MPLDEIGTDNDRLPQLPLTAYYLMVGLLWISTFFPEARLWGLNWYRYFSWYGQASLMLVGLALPVLASRLANRLSRKARQPSAHRRYSVAGLVVVAAWAIAFIILRGRTHFLGDGYQVLAKVQAGAEVIKPWDKITWAIQKALYILIGSGESAALMALQILSAGCGLLFLTMVFFASTRLFETGRDRILFLLLMAGGGYTLLFFGYVENYPLFVLAVAGFGLTGLLVAREFWSRWTLLIPLVISILLHPFAASMIPAALYLLLRDSSLSRRWMQLGAKARFAVVGAPIVIIILVIYYLWTRDYFFRFAFVPPVSDRFTVEGYTMFSTAHVLDYANLLFMLAPGLLVVLSIVRLLPVSSILRRVDYRFLALLSATCLIMIFVLNPRLGMPRDWDLFSFAGLPLVLLLAYLILDARNAIPARATVAMLSIALGLLVLGPRVISQALPETSIAVFDSFADLDVIKSRNGRFLLQEYLEKHGRMEEHRTRARINSVALPHERLSKEAEQFGEEGHLMEAVARFRQAIKYDPGYHYAWANLGVVYRWMDRFDSALICLTIADGLNPYSFSTQMKLAGTYYGKGDPGQAERYWNKATGLDAEDIECRTHLLNLYRNQGRQAEYEAMLADLIGREDASPELLTRAVQLNLDKNHFDAAAELLQRALDEGLDTVTVQEIQRQYPQVQVLQ